MAPLLEELGVELVGISRDDVEQARLMHEQDALGRALLLADPELEVVRQFGLEHHKTVVTTSPLVRVFGLPLGMPKGTEAMAIPTTLLIDEQGIIRWIDQAEDYRVRSDSARVEAALRSTFS